MVILGIDASTATIAFCVIDSTNLDSINRDSFRVFQPKGTFWEKYDQLANFIDKFIDEFKITPNKIFIESPLSRFLPGFSSAGTIITLQKWNISTQILLRNKFGTTPIEISAATARKACKIKLVPKKKDSMGRDHKHQTYDHIMSNDLKHIVWDFKKNGNVVDVAYDQVDAYVVARGGLNLKL